MVIAHPQMESHRSSGMVILVRDSGPWELSLEVIDCGALRV